MKLSKLGTAILSMLGFNQGCSEPACVYGCPHANFQAVGTVTDEKGDVVANAQISPMLYRLGSDNAKREGYGWGTFYTDENGNYVIRNSEVLNCEIVLVTKKEGYMPDTTSFVVRREDFKNGDNRWYLGSCKVTNNIVLKKSDGTDGQE